MGVQNNIVNENEEFEDIELDNLEELNYPKKNLFSFTEKKDYGLVILGSVFSVLSSLCPPVQTIIYGRIFSKLSDFFIYNFNGFDDFISDVSLYCVMIIVIGAANLIFTWLMVYIWMKNGENQLTRIRGIIFNNILIPDNVEWVENFKNINGEITQLNRCIEELRTGNAEVLGLLIQAITGCIAFFVVAMVFSWSVSLVTLALTPLFLLCGWILGKLMIKYADKENLYSAQSSRILNWCLFNPAITRLFNGKDSDLVNFNTLIDRCSKVYYKLENAVYLNAGIIKALALLMFVQGFWFGTTMIRLHRVRIHEVFTAFSACFMLASQVSSLVELLGDLQRSRSAIGKIIAFVEASQVSSKTSRDSVKISPTFCEGSIEFKNVQFKYKTKQDIILKNISLKFRPKEFNFVIGKSGSGKSTLAQLIMNFYKPSSGKVFIDDMDINSLNKQWLNDNITLVQLNPIIFNHSLKENLTMALFSKYQDLTDIPDNLIQDAISFSLLTKVVGKVGGINTIISNDHLSGGEKQRVALARAKLRDTPILIIDEGLNALDIKTKSILLKSIKEWRRGKTTIFITHELDQIEDDDFVVLAEEGLIVKSGRFLELSNEPFIKNANIKKGKVFDDFSSVDTDFDDDEDDLKARKSSERLSKYHYLKNPFILRNLELGSINHGEKIYPLTKILAYCFKTINYKWLIFLGIFISALHGVSNPIFSYLFARLLDNMMSTSMGINASSDLKFWSAIVIGVAIAHGLTYYLANLFLSIASEKWINSLRRLSLERINDQDMSYFYSTSLRPSEMNALLMNDVRDLRVMVSKFLSVSINLIVLVFLGLIFALVLGWKLALTGIAFVVVILIITFVYAKVMQKRETNYKNKINDLEVINYEMLNGIKTISSLNLSTFFRNEFNDKMKLVQALAKKRAIHMGFALALKQLIVSVATGILMYYGMRLVGAREYDRLKFFQVITLLMLTFTNASILLDELPNISKGQRCGSYIMNLLDIPPSKVETSGTITPISGNRNELIKFDNVTFGYRANKSTIKDVSFTIKEKDIFGIIGDNGSGKSTIIGLLTRLYGNYDGSIMLNNEELCHINPEWLREFTSILPQSPVFFEGTIYDNLTYGLSKEKLINTNINEYLKLCNIYSFVNSLPDGIQSNIGSLTESSLISSGQLQRLSMVRAIIRKPKVLILDECTSNLDNQNLLLMKELILKLQQELGMTIILISHSNELLNITTNSIQIDQGQVV